MSTPSASQMQTPEGTPPTMPRCENGIGAGEHGSFSRSGGGSAHPLGLPRGGGVSSNDGRGEVVRLEKEAAAHREKRRLQGRADAITRQVIESDAQQRLSGKRGGKRAQRKARAAAADDLLASATGSANHSTQKGVRTDLFEALGLSPGDSIYLPHITKRANVFEGPGEALRGQRQQQQQQQREQREQERPRSRGEWSESGEAGGADGEVVASGSPEHSRTPDF